MSTDFRALCAEMADAYLRLLEHINNSTRLGYEPSDDPLLLRTRAELAEPFRPAPMAKGGRALQLVLAVGADCAGGAHLSTEQCRLAFDLLAKAYPGTVAPVPLIEPADAPAAVAEGPSDEELLGLHCLTTKQLRASGKGECNHLTAFARAVLARWGQPPAERHAAPVPAPLSERPWEREGWCDEQGQCWFGREESVDWSADWMLATPEEVEEFCANATRTVCLPAHALPLPAPQGGEVKR